MRRVAALVLALLVGSAASLVTAVEQPSAKKLRAAGTSTHSLRRQQHRSSMALGAPRCAAGAGRKQQHRRGVILGNSSNKLEQVCRYSGGGAAPETAVGEPSQVWDVLLGRVLKLPATASMAEVCRVMGAKLAGLVIIVGSMGLKVPQIVKILEARSALGLSFVANYFEVPLCSNAVIYHFKKDYPFSAYGENLFALIQNVAVVGLMWRFATPAVPRREMAGLTALFIGSCLGAYALPDKYQPLLVLSSTPILIMVSLPQILVNHRQGHTGQMAPLTIVLKLGGCAIRLATTLVEIGLDGPLLLNYGLGTLFNAILLGQWWFTRAATEAAVGKKKPVVRKTA